MLNERMVIGGRMALDNKKEENSKKEIKVLELYHEILMDDMQRQLK